jgi:EAL domain-containing protein (putative c-di-GMP-specific phosphodiesterase class I)
MIPPDEFISIAEHEGLIIELGEAIFQMACSFVDENRKNGIDTPKIAINLSIIQLTDRNLFKKFISIASKHDLKISDFSYEVTETSAMENISTILNVIDEFKAKGCTFMLDDFGTGYASLSQLNTLSVDIIKIDKSFTDLIESDNESNKNVIKAILSMAEALEIDIVVEGVETKKQLDWLVEQGVEKIQGYYFSKPLKPDVLIQRYLT